MAASIEALEDWVAPLLERLQPRQRRQLAVAIARELRRDQVRNITAQRGPDGAKFAPRKRQPDARGRIRAEAKRKSAMFTKLRTARHLKAEGTSEAAIVGFMGRTARIARIHHDGLADEVTAGGPVYRYPTRELLGISDNNVERVRDLLLAHLSTL